MKYLLTVFTEDSLPKINHMGTIMVNYNGLFLAEERGNVPVIKDLEVSKKVWHAIPWAPTETGKSGTTKYATDEALEWAYKGKNISKKDYERLTKMIKENKERLNG